jgi:hypothetical protein
LLFPAADDPLFGLAVAKAEQMYRLRGIEGHALALFIVVQRLERSGG